tara:strand:+ start:29337 stop:29804 length:468 start_codon:yes stop_codon:yes gene_type:complete
MSYVAPDTTTGFSTKRLQIAEVAISGQPTVNNYFTWHSVVADCFDASPNIDPNDSTILILDAGHYLGRVTLAITRSGYTTYENYQFKLEADGSLVGRRGQTSWHDSHTADFAEADFSSGQTIRLKLKCIDYLNNYPSLLTNGVNESRLYLWRSEL